MSSSDETVCAYCADAVLEGTESPEHPLPLAINARLTTTAVCDPCNRWAGHHIDQPWLDDVFVGHARFIHRIPNRRGDVLPYDPLLVGVTADGTRVGIGHDARPVALNSPVVRDHETGHITIKAKDRADLDRLLAREVRKAEAAGRQFSPGRVRVAEEQPKLEASHCVDPGAWERLSAKAALGLLARTQAPSWRRSDSATMLRRRMHDLERPVGDVHLYPARPYHAFAPEPASAVHVMTIAGRPVAGVSLLGIFAVCFELAADLSGVDLMWISDPIRAYGSALGTFAEALVHRVALGDLGGVEAHEA